MTVRAIKVALKKLSLSQRMEIVHWVTSADDDAWDEEMNRDAESGKLDFLVKQAEDAAKKRKLLPIPRP